MSEHFDKEGLMDFDSKVVYRGSFSHAFFSNNVIKEEPMFFNCDLSFAWDHGGRITREFLQCLPRDWMEDVVLDSRVHMLMVGWYPCIPGWHHDDVPRSTKTGQPNYLNPEYHSEHLMGMVNADVCPTQFVVDNVKVSEPDIHKTVYRVWDKEIQEMVDKNLISTYSVESGRYIQFDAHAFHRGVPAVKDGWRWFARLSRKTDRTKNVSNELRKQVQVYLEYPTMGW
jgi:hypothetical protein